jgi:hypothetical protein
VQALHAGVAQDVDRVHAYAQVLIDALAVELVPANMTFGKAFGRDAESPKDCKQLSLSV